MLLLKVIIIYIINTFFLYNIIYGEFRGFYPNGCDNKAALKCEYDFLLCKLFNGPANDRDTLCNCASEFYGVCLRLAGCETANEVGPLTLHEVYMKTCVDFIMKNNCPDPLICGINCATDDNIIRNDMKIVPFNNHGVNYLRIRTCLFKVHSNMYSVYSTIEQRACQMNDFISCNRFIPPHTFVPVALNINTTYIEIDYCEKTGSLESNPTIATYNCSIKTDRVYGSQYLFPRSYDVLQTKDSICKADGNCLGTFCDKKYNPSICSPKTINQILGSGEYYMTIGKNL